MYTHVVPLQVMQIATAKWRAQGRREAPAFECDGEFSWALRRASRHAPFHNQPDHCVRNLIEGTRAVFTVYLQELGFFKET